MSEFWIQPFWPDSGFLLRQCFLVFQLHKLFVLNRRLCICVCKNATILSDAWWDSLQAGCSRWWWQKLSTMFFRMKISLISLFLNNKATIFCTIDNIDFLEDSGRVLLMQLLLLFIARYWLTTVSTDNARTCLTRCHVDGTECNILRMTCLRGERLRRCFWTRAFWSSLGRLSI